MVFSQDNRYRYTMDRTNNGDTQLTVLYNDKSSKKYKRKYLLYPDHLGQDRLSINACRVVVKTN